MSPNDVKDEGVTINHRNDIKLLKSLINLESGQIVPEHQTCTQGETIGEFLADFIHLPDALLYYDRLILPRPKDYYIEKIGDSFVDSNLINGKLKDILYFPTKEIYKIDRVENLHNRLMQTIKTDPRPYLIALLESPDTDKAGRWLKCHGHLDKMTSLTPYYAGGAREIVQWLKTVDISEMYSSIPDDISEDPILSKTNIDGSVGYSVYLASNIPVLEAGYYTHDFDFFDIYLKERMNTAKNTLQIVLKTLSDVRRDKHKELVEKGIISTNQIYEIPFTLGLLIEGMTTRSDPVEIVDTIVNKRNERSIRKFREWLKNGNQERWREGVDINYKNVFKIQAEIDQASANLRAEFSNVSISQKIVRHLPHGIALASEAILTGILPLPSCIRDLGSIGDTIISNVFSPHVAHMQKLGRAGIKISKPLKHIFGKQGEELGNILRYYSEIDQKVDLIHQMKIRSR